MQEGKSRKIEFKETEKSIQEIKFRSSFSRNLDEPLQNFSEFQVPMNEVIDKDTSESRPRYFEV